MGRSQNTAFELELAGAPANLLEARKKSEAVPLPVTLRDQVRRVDVLIDAALEACTTGQLAGTKRNPSFQNLETLVRVRKRIIEQARLLPPEEQSVEDLLEETNRLLGKAN